MAMSDQAARLWDREHARGRFSNKRTFEQFMQEVNKALLALCGMASDDLPDWRYHDDYTDGVSPGRCARRAIKYAKDC